MRLLNPAMLIWGLLLAAPVLLYLFRRRPRRVRVSTLLFFKTLARAYREAAWLRHLKKLLSFLLNAAIIIWAVGALARPVVAPKAGALRSVVIVVDRSASMAARNRKGTTRLAAAVRRVRERLAGLSAGVGVMVMTYDRRPEILLAFSLDRREVERALARIAVRPIEGDAAPALLLARRMARLDTPASVWHATDAARAEAGVEHISVALPEPANVGITGFQLRRLPLARSRFQAFVQLHGSGPAPLETELEIRIDGQLLAVRSMTLRPNGRERLVIPVDAGEGSVLTLKASARGDVLGLDDAVHARIPPLRPIRVLWVSPDPDPFTELALAALAEDDDIAVYKAAPSAWPPAEEADVVILDQWLPAAWPRGPAVVVIHPPDGGLGPLRAAAIRGPGLPVERVRATDDRHPVLYGVATARVAVTQTAVLEAGGTLEPLWVGPSGPLLVAGETGGQRIVAMAFEPERSEQLPLLASYPLLLGNAIYWSAEARDDPHTGQSRKAGDLVTLGGTTITWSTPGGAEASVPLHARSTELDRLGLWETDAGESGSSALLSRRETQLPATPARAGTEGSPQGPSLLRGDLTKLLAWLALAFLLLEAWLFHRYAVY